MSEPNARTATIHYTVPPQDITGGYLIPKIISADRKGRQAAIWRWLGAKLYDLSDSIYDLSDSIHGLAHRCYKRGMEDRDTTGWVKLGEIAREE